MKNLLVTVLLGFGILAAEARKPLVWIYTDMTDPALPGNNHMGTINDPDDVSAMAGYLLMSNEFRTLGIVVGSTHRSAHRHTPDQARWARHYVGAAYRADLTGLNQALGGYPPEISFLQSSIKESGERFDPDRSYEDLASYATVAALIREAGKTEETINVLCWGSLTEPAIAVSHCLATGKEEILKRLRFIAHWTNSSLHQGTPEHPERVANCREDSVACAYLKEKAASGAIRYYECGAIGQHGIVSGGPQGDDYFDQFRVSALGRVFVEGKYVNGRVDHSDAATYWTLLKGWGVDLEDLRSDGVNSPEIESANKQRFREHSGQIHDELLRRVRLAAGTGDSAYPYNNPVITHMYTADAAPHVMPDGRVWMVTSVDHPAGGGYATMHAYHAFSSADMVHWTDHGEILHLSDLTGGEEPEGEDWALWAPDMIYRHGTYYLYFPVRILHTDTIRPDGGRVVTSYIAVASCDRPDGRFRVVNPRLEGTRGIDPAVFIDDDDTPYLYWGSHMAAELAGNMVELAGRPVRMEVGTDRFMEASWMHKRGDTYYLSYHTKYDWTRELNAGNLRDPNRRKSELWYSVSDRPTGPFTLGGVLNYEPGEGVRGGPDFPGGDFVPWRLTLSNHGGITEYHGSDYLFYHTSALSSWKQDRFRERGTWTQRSVCIDRIGYREDGSVIPVQQTLGSVDPVLVDQPSVIRVVPGETAVTPDRPLLDLGEVDLGSGYYYMHLETDNPETGASLEVRLDDAGGRLAGSFSPGTLDRETFLRGVRGRRNVFLVFNGLDEVLHVREVRFSGGNGSLQHSTEGSPDQVFP